MALQFSRQKSLPPGRAFTLAELLVSMAVLLVLLLLVVQLFNSAAGVARQGGRSMDANSQARTLLDRLSIDFSRMIRRTDIDYYLKGRPAANSQQGGVNSAVNDQIAFYCDAPGYYPNSSFPGPVSLVAYRVNSTTRRLERLGKGLVWNGDASGNTPMVFLPIPMASPLPSPLLSPLPSVLPTPAWPQAANGSADPDYEPLGPQVFRFEYYYVLKGQDVTTNPAMLSDTPWDVRAPLSHTSVNGLQDVAAIAVAVAVIDAKTRALISDLQLSTLAGQMPDFVASMKPGELEARWQAAINAAAVPRAASSAIHVYSRSFYLTSVAP